MPPPEGLHAAAERAAAAEGEELPDNLLDFLKMGEGAVEVESTDGKKRQLQPHEMQLACVAAGMGGQALNKVYDAMGLKYQIGPSEVEVLIPPMARCLQSWLWSGELTPEGELAATALVVSLPAIIEYTTDDDPS